MQIDRTTTWGDFFLMQSGGEWRLRLKFDRPGCSSPTEADFAYAHTPDL
jgi:hypothetical protein